VNSLLISLSKDREVFNNSYKKSDSGTKLIIYFFDSGAVLLRKKSKISTLLVLKTMEENPRIQLFCFQE